MLARRFTLVCLAAMLAGGSLAMLIEDTNRSPYAWKSETARACPFGVTRDCLRLIR